MRALFYTSIFIFFFGTEIYAQGFIGYVKKADSTSSAIFQAKVEITEGNNPFKMLKSYFDGSFKFRPNKNQKYLIKISYPGYTDTSYTISTDKNANPNEQEITVKLKKDGMRLMGAVISRDENFPINGATVIIRNVMTRKEDRITTGIDGKYNFKLEYETNYRVWIDKRSTGIFNMYKDTSFYISTIGFNEPLNYKLDISLDEMEEPTTTIREGYDASKQLANENLKPVITIKKNEEKKNVIQKDTVPAIAKISKGNRETDSINVQAVQLKQPKKAEIIPSKETVDTLTVSSKAKEKKEKKRKKKKDEIPVEIIRDTPRDVVPDSEKSKSEDLLEITRQKAITDKEAREKEILRQKEEEQKKQDAKRKQEEIYLKQKITQDSLTRIKTDSVNAAMQKAAKEKRELDSITKVKQVKEQIFIQPKHADSATHTVKSAPNNISRDTSEKKSFYLSKTQEELIAAAELFAKRKKFVQDSIDRAKGKGLKIQKEGSTKGDKK